MSQLGLEMSNDERAPKGGGRPPGGKSGRAVLLALIGLLAVVVLVAFLGIRAITGGSQDFSGEGTGSVVVVVAKGDALRTIGAKLADAGVVASSDAFLEAAANNPNSGSVSPGTYRLHLGMSGADAVTLLLDPASRDASKLVVPEGLRVTQTVAAAAKATGLSVEALNASLAKADALGLPGEAEGNAEGYLFPATYSMTRGTSADTVISTMIARYAQAANEIDLDARAAALRLTTPQVLTVASIVQAEGVPSDYSKIARVIYNRLKAGMPLQLDSTVNYGLGTFDLHLSAKQLRSQTPYNTYLHKGLPPGPINSPGDQAIEAALSPAKGPWLYFVTTDPKTHATAFATTYPEFLKLKAKFKQNTG